MSSDDLNCESKDDFTDNKNKSKKFYETEKSIKLDITDTDDITQDISCHNLSTNPLEKVQSAGPAGMLEARDISPSSHSKQATNMTFMNKHSSSKAYDSPISKSFESKFPISKLVQL